jgi:hypothetical protein
MLIQLFIPWLVAHLFLSGEIYTQPPAEIKGLRPPLLAKGCFAITKKTATQAQRVMQTKKEPSCGWQIDFGI